MLTSKSEQLTPAALSIASVKHCPPFNEYSIRALCVMPKLPPSPITLQRNSAPLTRRLSFALSPTSAWLSCLLLTYVPIPPFHNRSTDALSNNEINSVGVTLPALIAKALAISGVTVIDLAERSKMPPPAEISLAL